MDCPTCKGSGKQRTEIRDDITFDLSDIPAGSTITSATLCPGICPDCNGSGKWVPKRDEEVMWRGGVVVVDYVEPPGTGERLVSFHHPNGAAEQGRLSDLRPIPHRLTDEEIEKTVADMYSTTETRDIARQSSRWTLELVKEREGT